MIINASATDILPTYADNSFTMVLADIPYDVVSRDSGGLRNLDKGDADQATFDLDFVIREVSRLAPSVYVWCSTEQVSELRAGLVARGMTTRLCIWHKSNPSPMNGQHLWLSGIECCVFGRRKGATFNEHCQVPVFRGPKQQNQVHPTQKPLWLMERLIQASSNPGDKVLDFCCGSGTTCVAAKKLGREYIGIEINEAYCRIAEERLSVG